MHPLAPTPRLNDGRYLNPRVQYLPFSCVKTQVYAVFYNHAFPFVQSWLSKTLKIFHQNSNNATFELS